MTTTDKLFFNVVGGPSKFDLMLSLFDGNKTPRRTVEFHLEGVKTPIEIAITGIQQEDGSGESWCFQGWLANQKQSFNIDGYFSTKGRRGWLRFEVRFHYVMKGSEQQKVINPSDQLAVDQYVDQLRK